MLIFDRILIMLQKIMKGYIFIGLLCTLAVQQTVLISSSDTNTVITSPPGVNIGLSTFHEASPQYANYIGFGAKWVYKAGSQSWPVGDTATFVTQFYADCESPATLIACADNEFSVSVNGATAVTGKHFNAKSYIPIKLICGLNTLMFVVKNKDNGSPAGLIFAVTQDQNKCYTCLTPLSFYNRDTCRCECTEGCKCAPANQLFTWKPYPVCGCTCAVTRTCQNGQYWNDKTCSCNCKKIVCPSNQIQDSKTCQCKGKCLPFRACNLGEIWDFDLCTCVRLGIGQQCDYKN